MTTAWHCQLHHQEYGPVSVDQLREMAEQGQLGDTTLLRPAEDPQGWKPLSQCELPQVVEAIPAPGSNGSAHSNGSGGAEGARKLQTFVQAPIGSLDDFAGSLTTDIPSSAPVVDSAFSPSPPSQASPSDPTVPPASIQSAPAGLQPLPTPSSLTTQPAPQQPAAAFVQPLPAPVQPAPAQSAPVHSAPAPVHSAPVQSAPIQSAPVQSALVQSATIHSAPVQTVQPTAGVSAIGLEVASDTGGPDDPRNRFRNRKKNYLPLVIGLGIAATVGVVTLVIALNHGNGTDETSTDPQVATNASNPNVETNPLGVGGDGTPASTAPSSSPSEPVDRSNEVSSWSALGRTMTLKGVCSLKLQAVWLETTPEGQRLMAQVQMTYLATTPIRYSSWHGTGAQKLAAAATLLYPAQGGLEKRLHLTSVDNVPPSTAPATLIEGAVVTETFSFPGPAETDLVARLLLPKEAIGRKTPPFGFEIPRTTWLAGVNPSMSSPPGAIDPAPNSPTPTNPTADNPATDNPTTNEPPAAPSTPPTTPDPMPKNDNPPSIQDLIKKSVENEKKKAAPPE